MLTLFNISHFSSTSGIAAMAKRAQQDSGEGRVTAKSRPMMNLTARTPSFVSSSASANPGGPRMDIKILNNLFLTIERGNPWKRQDQTILRIMVHPGLLKCGKVEMESTIDQGNLRKILGIHWGKLTLIVENIFSAGQRILQGTKKTIHERTGKPASENVHGKANFEKFIVGSDTTECVNKPGTKCEFDRKECQTMQRIVPNIQ